MEKLINEVPDEIKSLLPQNTTLLVNEIVTYLNSMVSLTIETDSQFQNAGELVKDIAKYSNTLEASRDSLVRPLNTKVTTFNSYFKTFSSALYLGKKVIQNSISAYNTKKALERAEAQRILDEKARKEREKLEAEARAKREQEDALRRDAEEIKLAAKRETNEKKRQELLAQAQKMEVKADTVQAKAEIKEQTAQTVVAPVVSFGTPKISGMSEVKKYKAEVSDKEKFVKWCVELNKLQYLEIDTSALSKMLQASKGLESYPGINCKIETEFRQRV